jgi:hypothetical protein
LGTLQIGCQQAQQLGVQPRVQYSPYLELCCLRMCARSSYENAHKDLEHLTGIRVSAKTQERIVKRNPIAAAQSSDPITEMALDGGMVRLSTPKGEPSEWRQYKAIRVNGDGVGMAWFQADPTLRDWSTTLSLDARVYCLGDGHPGIWSTYQQMNLSQPHEEILDWFHLKENLYKVGGSVKRLHQAESLLWEGKVPETLTLLEGLKSEPARKFRAYLEHHRTRIPNYHYYQLEGIPIGSGSVESLIKQIDARIQLTGAQWQAESVPQILALRCAYLNDQLHLHSLNSG